LASVVGIFAYLRGAFTPNELTPGRLTDAFEKVDGLQPGFRRNHAKGVGVGGQFESNGQGVRLSKAAVFQPGNFPVIGRFSLGGGQPYQDDAAKTVRGLGLQFTAPDGEVWRTAMINLPVFPFRTPEAFYENLLTAEPDPATGKPDPAKKQAFADRHPETIAALKIITSKPPSSGFANSTFHGLNAFRFTNEAGESHPVRWELVPEEPFVPAGGADPADKKFLFAELIGRIHRQPPRWHLIVIVGQPGDSTVDPTLPWPPERERVDVGTLVLDRVESDDTGPATDITFDPLVLPKGIGPSDDPFLSARSAVYARSYTRRAGESKQPAAITPADVEKQK
jgi:catalase